MPDPSPAVIRTDSAVQRCLFADFDSAIALHAQPVTVSTLIAAYLDHLKVRLASDEYSPQTLADVRRDLGRFAKIYGDKSLALCRRQDLTDWLTRNPQWKSNSTKKRNLAEICACWQWAEDEELIARNPYRRPRGLKLRTRRRPDAQPAQYVAFMRRGSRVLRRILFFLANSGARPHEARELTWPMVFLEESVVIKEKHKTVNLQREPKPRIIGLDPCLLRFLRNLYRTRRLDQPYVFVNVEGQPWTKDGLVQHFRRARERIMKDPVFAQKHGVDASLTLYCFRHGYTTEGIMGGVGERQMADQLGHTDTRLIAHYSHAATKSRHLRRVAAEVRRQRREGRRG